MVKSRRQEHTEATRWALLESAEALFVERGYAGTSVEDVVRAARLTSGALYHHFRGKRELFEAVFDDVEAAAIARVGDVALGAGSPAAVLDAGLEVFLDLCLEPRFRRIVVQEGPVALGWDRWRELEARSSLGLLQVVLDGLAAEGGLRVASTELLARTLFGALLEAGLAVGTAEDPVAARADAGEVLRALVSGTLARPSGAGRGPVRR